MARQRSEQRAKSPKIKLQQPDRSGPDPSHKTLIDLAEERSLFAQADAINVKTTENDDEDGEALVGRLGESILWSLSLAMLHFTLDVLVCHQYAIDISWPEIISRAAQAFPSNPFYPEDRNIANQASYLILLLLSSSSQLASDTPSPPSPINTTCSSPNLFFRRQHICRLLSHTRQQHAWLLCRNETSSTARLSLDLVSH